MITGYKPNGNFTTLTDFGKKIEGETRQCIHCQFTWIYKPGSGDIRGFCTRHNGFVCDRIQCIRSQKRMIDKLNWPFSCITFADYNKYRFERFLKDYHYQVTPAGVLIPISLL